MHVIGGKTRQRLVLVSKEVSLIRPPLIFFVSKQLFFHQQCMQDFLGKSDPYLEFAKENPDGSFTTVHRTEVTIISSNGGL